MTVIAVTIQYSEGCPSRTANDVDKVAEPVSIAAPHSSPTIMMHLRMGLAFDLVQFSDETDASDVMGRSLHRVPTGATGVDVLSWTSGD